MTLNVKKLLPEIVLAFYYCSCACGYALDQESCELCSSKSYYEHIFCMFPNPDPPNSPGCSEVNLKITDVKFRTEILDWHNNYRNKFANGTWKDQSGIGFPTASNMRYLHYDYQLEKLCRRNLQNCLKSHENCRKLERFKYWQNLGSIESKNWKDIPSDSEAIWKGWIDQIYDFDMNDLNSYGMGAPSGNVYDFVGVTWATTRVVGCAQMTSKDTTQGKYRIDLCCNYGPDDVSVGKPLYLQGTTCSACPPGTKCGLIPQYPYLCGGINSTDKIYFDQAAGRGISLEYSLCLTVVMFVGINN